MLFNASFTSAALAALLIPTASAQSCSPPTTPAGSTYGACAVPLNYGAANDPAPVLAFMQNSMGGASLAGQDARPVGTITRRRCTAPGANTKTGDVAGWSIDSVFNPKGCPPGSKCL
jgi:hypothetical protein